MPHPKDEVTYLMVKPDGLKRGLTGEIIKRIEQRGLKVVGLRMIKPTRQMIDNHYPKDEKWLSRIGIGTTKTCETYGYDVKKEFGTDDPLKIGKIVRSQVLDYMLMAPLVGIVVKGVHAVEMVRKLVGPTAPADATIGTIRGDFSIDSRILATKEKRSLFNIVHASETQAEAKHEIEHWFGEYELLDYERTDEMV